MAAKRKIGIVFRPTGWTGGVYYIQNFIRALGAAKNDEQPEIILFCEKADDYNFIKEKAGYTKLRMQLIPADCTPSFFPRQMNKISRKLTGKNIFEKRFKEKIDFVFPYSYDPFLELIDRKIYWIPDLQDKYFPELFDETTVIARDKHYKQISMQNEIVVFSSKAAFDDFRKFYPNYRCKPFILHFASMDAPVYLPGKTLLDEKYKLPGHYFYSPNQFWRHKNHKVIIEAVKILKEKNIFSAVAFSGNENDPRSPEYVSEIREMVRSYSIEDRIYFLGFIDREDVFGLMKSSLAVIQPSKFEGWSTVVEDSLSVNTPLILSDLEVNKEQMEEMGQYFMPEDAHSLSDLMQKVIVSGRKDLNLNYQIRREKYTNQILQLITAVVNE